MTMLEKFRIIWDSQLERISVARHCSNMKSFNQHAVHSKAYSATPRGRRLEEQEVKMVLAYRMVEPAQTALEVPIVLGSIKVDYYYFVTIFKS